MERQNENSIQNTELNSENLSINNQETVNAVFNVDNSQTNNRNRTNSRSRNNNRRQAGIPSVNPNRKDLRLILDYCEQFKNEKPPKKEKVSLMKKISISEITREINGYGYNYTMKNYFKTMLMVFAGLIGGALIFKLEFNMILILILTAIVLIPFIIVSQFKYTYEQKKFAEVVNYMQYVIFEFKKSPKIIGALIAAEDTLTGDIKEKVGEAIDYINRGIYDKDLYNEAFAIIEKDYACDRMILLHQFLKKIETEGGDYQTSINVLLDDINSWTQRIYTFQKNRANIKQKVLITIVLSLVICGSLTFMLPQEYSITGQYAYQVATTMVFAALMALYAAVQSKLNGSWLKSDKRPNKKVFEDYRDAVLGNVKEKRAKLLPIIVVLAAVAVYFLVLKNTTYAVFAGLGALVLWIQPAQNLKIAKKNTIKELTKEFPTWLRNLSVNLQKETVQVAINNSFEEAPIVLKPALIQFISDLDEDPVSIRPYTNFLADFDLPEIVTAVKMLYSLNAAGREEVVQQINTLVTRNNVMLEKAEIMRDQDSISITGFLVALPMGFATLKMVVDMMLVLGAFLSNLGGV